MRWLSNLALGLALGLLALTIGQALAALDVSRVFGWANSPAAISSPMMGCLTVTPSDSTLLTQNVRLIYVGAEGDISALMADGSTPVFKAVPVGAQLPISPQRINSTNTTATLLLACY